jgi:phosphoribosylanthranilate isomerase
VKVFIKICGITRLEDARTAVALGADALGFNFYPISPRYVSPEAAGAIIKSLDGPSADSPVQYVGVFVNETRSTVEAIVAKAGLTAVQFHGDEPRAVITPWPGLIVYRALRLRLETAEQQVNAVQELDVDALLIDAFSDGQYGGTGKTLDAAAIAACRAASRHRLIIAGGLTPENVQGIVSKHRPFGVDVASGVEEAPGIKCVAKLKEFIAQARS